MTLKTSVAFPSVAGQPEAAAMWTRLPSAEKDAEFAFTVGDAAAGVGNGLAAVHPLNRAVATTTTSNPATVGARRPVKAGRTSGAIAARLGQFGKQSVNSVVIVSANGRVHGRH
jgi:hypothetical protein